MRPNKFTLLVSASPAALGLLLWLCTPKPVNAAAQLNPGEQIWQTIGRKSITTPDWQQPASDYRVLRLNKAALEQQLASAPMERTADLRSSQTIVSLPMPNGSFQRFRVEQSPVLDAVLTATYPEIRSYRGQGIDDPTATVRFDSTPLGFHALILSGDHPAVTILPPDARDTSTYASSYAEIKDFKCGVNDSRLAKVSERATPKVANGAMLRTERIAVAATWEFCNTTGGNTVAGTIAAINAYLNPTNAIYERDLAIHMNLVNAPNVIYSSDNNVCGAGNNEACNANNDPYDNTNEATMLDQVVPDLRDKVGTANYDLGHVLGTAPSGSAGIAGLGVVCEEGGDMGPRKGAGSSRVSGAAGNASALSVFAHEVGHEHGASHSFNGTTNFCGPSRSGATAWEPGSGSTLMAYGGICGSDNLSGGRDLRFHNGSYNQVLTYLTASGACAAMTPSGNNVPTVDGGPNRTIPKQTPFTLTALAGDADAADVPNLRFAWEELDAGGDTFANPPYGDQAGDPATTTRPLFRAFPLTADKSRTFPSLTYILNNANVPPAVVDGFQSAESLPTVSRTMNFRCTARDMRGGVQDTTVVVTVDGNSGPFAVTSPNGGEMIAGTQNVTWSVNGTNAAPVSAANVSISLSTDGGNTFPVVLAANVPNTGTAMVAFPNGILTNTARVKVEAVGNIFFDISDANFSIAPGDGCPAVNNFAPQLGPIGTVVTINGVNFTGVNGITFNGTAATNFTVNSNTQITVTVPAGATGGALILSKPGCGNLTVGTFSVCPNPPVALSIDDGSIESASGAGANAYFVNRLTPAAYPASLSQVSIYFDAFQQFPAGTAIKVVAAANPGGTANIDNLTFTSVPATVGALGGFTTVNLPNAVTTNSGDFVVGFQVVGTPPAGSFPGPVDTTTSQGRSYTGNGTTFTLRPNGNFMIRASQVFTGCNSGPVVQFAKPATRTPENAGVVNLPITRTGDTSGTTTVNYFTNPGSATPGQDYIPVAGQLTFAPGETSKMISVPIIDDNSSEGNLTFEAFVETPGEGPAAPDQIASETVTIVDNEAIPPQRVRVVSRKLHAGVPYDIELPDNGTGVESRSGGVNGQHQVIFTFVNPVTFSGADVFAPSGSVSSVSGSGTRTVTVDLTGVTDGRYLSVALYDANDGVTVGGDVYVLMGVLVGDASGDGVVNSGDATITRNRSGQPVNATNFRADYNLDGVINSGDATIVRNRSGNFIP